MHIKRLKYAIDNTKDLFQLTQDSYKDLDDKNIEHIDQLIYRFTKLQDAMGLRLFPAILEQMGEEAVSRSFIDRLNRLEQLGIIRDADEWNIFREIRNQLAHEYPEEETQNAEALNELYLQIPKLIDLFNHIEKNVKR